MVYTNNTIDFLDWVLGQRLKRVSSSRERVIRDILEKMMLRSPLNSHDERNYYVIVREYGQVYADFKTIG